MPSVANAVVSGNFAAAKLVQSLATAPGGIAALTAGSGAVR